MSKSSKETKGTGMHATNIKHDNPTEFERNVSDVFVGMIVYERNLGQGDIRDIIQTDNGTYIHVVFAIENTKTSVKKRSFKIPDAFVSGRLTRYYRKGQK